MPERRRLRYTEFLFGVSGCQRKRRRGRRAVPPTREARSVCAGVERLGGVMALQNRVALVTGGSRGIGRGIAVKLAQDGARVAIAYRSNKTAAQQTLRQ